MNHSRKRSATLSSLITPPTPLREGQSTRLTLWISDANKDRVLLNQDAWPGVAVGDVIQVQSVASWQRKDDASMCGFCFVVSKDDGVAGKHGQQITVPKHLATVFNLQNHSKVILTKISKESVTADAIEVYFRDQYLGRCDMWRLQESLEEQCIHLEEKVTFAGCISATIRALYVKNKKVSSAYITPRTKVIFRSMSAKTTIFIQVCRELWDFADDGERYYEKICHFFLPALIERWQNASTTHVVTIVLVSRVFYESEEKGYAAGPLRRDPDSGQWYKDFYKVVVDLEVVHDWKPSLVYLKESFWTFQRDILLTHHYHRNLQTQQHQRESAGITTDDPEEDIPVRLVGRLSMAHEGPILEALNISLNPMESHYVDRSLVLTGSSMILISPGTGHFRVNKRLLQLTTTRMLDQGHGLDLVCLSKAPLHRSPVFSFLGVEPGTNESIPGLRDTDPLWVWEEEDGPITGLQPVRRRDTPQVKKILYWEPFWVSLSFWDQQNNVPFREDRFVPRARMYEIQMLGLLAHDVSTLAIPHLKANEGIQVRPVSGGGMTQEEAIKAARDQFDSDVFAFKSKEKTFSTALVRGAPTSSAHPTAGASHLPVKPPPTTRNSSEYGLESRPQLLSQSFTPERPKCKERPNSPTLSTSSAATTLANFNNNSRGPKIKATPPRLKSPPLPERIGEERARDSSPSGPSQRSHSPSQMSVRSTSTASAREAKRRSARPPTLTSKLGVGQSLFNFLTGRAGPSQAEASQVSIAGEKASRPPAATPSIAVSPATAHSTQQQEPIINIKSPSPIKVIAQPIAIKNTGSLPRRIAHLPMNQAEDPVKQQAIAAAGRPRSFASPVSSSPGQDSIAPTAIATRRPLEAAAAPPINPSRPMSILSQSQSSLARRWQHIFPHPTLQYQIKWKSMCTPACLPLTTEYYPSKTELEKAYQVYSYDVLVTPDVRGSFMLKRTTNWDEEEEWPLLVMRQMAALRLALGFQFIVAPHPTFLDGLPHQALTPGNETAISTRYNITGPVGGRYAAPVHPIGASEFLKSITDVTYLSMSNQIHRISFDPIEQVIRVARYVRRTTHSLESQVYQCLVWPRLGDGYREVSAAFSYPNLDMYGWNRMDMLVAGYEHDLAETLRYWRTRFVVIPSESPPTFAQLSGEKLSDEEIRLLGAEKLAELFHRARWYKPNERPEDFAPTRFLLTTLEPSACVLDETLTAGLDKIHEQGPLKKKPNSSKTVEDAPLATLAKAMREDDGVPMKENTWNRSVYPDSFTGDEFVSWLVREYKDVATREQGAIWGARLMEQGFTEHCRGAHGFLDGHYYYRLKDEYSVAQAPRGPLWFRGTASPGKQPGDTPLTLTANLEAVATRAGLTPASTPVRLTASKKSKRKLILSQTMIIDVDPGGKSKGSETAILHHDIIHNPYTALHFELNWMGTTARFIDDMVQSWGRSIEKYGLRLVEAYVDEIVRIQDKNVFQSTFPIRLAVPPPVIPNLSARLPEGSNADHYFEHCILRHFGYILDIEAGGRYSDSVDVCYSYRRSSFSYNQFVHKTGLAFVQVIGGKEGFRWLINRLAGTSNSFSNSHSRNTGGGPGGVAPGGGGAGGGRAGTGGTGAPSIPTPPERPDRDRTATSVLIQLHLKGLSEFCSDPARLQAFYWSITDMLPSDNNVPAT